MKKTLIILGSVIGFLIILMIAVPFVFKGKIAAIARKSANNAVNAKVDFADVDLSLFRHFPHLNVSLKNLTVTGIGDFANEKLIQADALSTSINLSSLWKSSMSISEIYIDKPIISLKVNKAGKSNWDIVKSDSTKVETKKSSANIDLEKIHIEGAALIYNDESTPMLFSLDKGVFDISGKMKGSNSTLDIKGNADDITFEYNGSKYAQNIKAAIDGQLKADFDKKAFTFLKNRFLINKLPLEADGTFVLGEKDYDFDITFKSSTSSFADLLGFIPEKYQSHLKDVQAQGNVSFNGFFKGRYNDKTFPGFNLDIKVDNGKLKYPKLPKEIDQINVAANINKAQGDMDLTKIDLEKFGASLAGNPVEASLHVATPVSDPMLKGNLKGKVNFTELKQAIPMDSIDLDGIMEALIDFDGRYSSIEKQQYQNFKTTGTVSLKNFEYGTPALTQRVKISAAGMDFNPKAITLTNLSGNMGKSDFSAKGAIANYWAYVLKKGSLNGNLDLSSKYLDFNVLKPTSKGAAADTSSKPFEVPDKINLTINTVINQLVFDKLNITNVTGKAIVENKKLVLDGLNMHMLGGSMVMSGEYNTPKQQVPSFNLKMNVKDFDIPSAFRSVSTIRYLLPLAGESTGNFNTDLSINGKIGNGYTPVFTSLNGDGLLSTRNVELAGTSVFNQIAKYFRKDMFNQVKIGDLTTRFKIVNGGLVVSPFTTKIAGQEVTISGKQSPSKDLDYRLDFKVNKNDLSQDVNKYIGFVPGSENIGLIPVGVVINGTVAKPDVKVDMSDARKLVETEFKKKAGTQLQDAVKKLGLDKLFK